MTSITLAFLNAQLAPLGSRLLKVRFSNGDYRWVRVPLPGYPEGQFEPQFVTLTEAWQELRTLTAACVPPESVLG